MKKLWDQWEITAIEYLKSKWYIILMTNYKFGRVGEIDIVASKNGFTVFVEVKSRKNDSFGNPKQFIDFTKRKKIYKTILSYMSKYQIDEEKIRFDVISLLGGNIEHIEGYEL